MAPRRHQYFLFDLVLWVTLLGLLFGFARWFWRTAQHEDLSIGSFVFFPIGFGVWFTVWAMVRAKRTGPTCEACGRRFIAPAGQPSPTMCPRCRAASGGPEQRRRDQTVGWLFFLCLSAILGTIIGQLVWNSMGSRFGGPAWIVVPILALGAIVGVIATLLIVVVFVTLIRNRLLLVERHALAFARKCAGEDGLVERSGPMTIWSCDRTVSAPILTEQLTIVRQRFEGLVNQPIEALPPLRVFVFDKRRAYLTYHRNVFDETVPLDGVYLSRPACMITLSTEVTPYRLHDLAKTARVLFVFYLLDMHKGFLPAVWLQSGISGALGNDPGSDCLRHVNRRMKVSLSKGTALDAAELFSTSPRALFRRTRGSADFANFERLCRFTGQSWSVVEYLIGADAPADRLSRFRAFLSDLPKRESQQERVFVRHFGYGFRALLDGWRAWVQQLELGSDRPPPSPIREAVLERLIPRIRDGGKPAQDRVQAIRELGLLGYALGADSLIETLRNGDDRIVEEAAWALESISGFAWGTDPDRWALWWAGLDPMISGAAQPAEPPAPMH
jgi:hypothetical protein